MYHDYSVGPTNKVWYTLTRPNPISYYINIILFPTKKGKMYLFCSSFWNKLLFPSCIQPKLSRYGYINTHTSFHDDLFIISILHVISNRLVDFWSYKLIDLFDCFCDLYRFLIHSVSLVWLHAHTQWIIILIFICRRIFMNYFLCEFWRIIIE